MEKIEELEERIEELEEALKSHILADRHGEPTVMGPDKDREY